MNDIEFKSTFDKIEFDIAMEMYFKHNDKIASINDHLGDMYSYKDLEDAEALEEYDTLQEYKKALKEKCDAFDKAIELLEQENNVCPRSLTLEKSYIIEVEKINKVLSILKGGGINET